MKEILALCAALFTFPLFSCAENQSAIFGMGCFWCAQSDFDKLPGVIKTVVGYDGGTELNPTYEQVSSGRTQYVESIQVIFDPKKISYPEILDYFWHHIDPTVKDSQFCDHGPQYRSAIFYLNDAQKAEAETSLKKMKVQFPLIYTQITPSTQFYPAETYHQNYYKKNPVRYKYYRWNCGRDARIQELWDAKNKI